MIIKDDEANNQGADAAPTIIHALNEVLPAASDEFPDLKDAFTFSFQRIPVRGTDRIELAMSAGATAPIGKDRRLHLRLRRGSGVAL
jgi:hypothetical protein